MKTTIFIDESGTLPDVKDKVIVVAAVGTITPMLVEKIISEKRLNWAEAKRKFLNSKLSFSNNKKLA